MHAESPARRPSGRHAPCVPSRAAVACALVGFALRAGYGLLVATPPEMPGLSRKYLACAENVLAGHGWFLQVGQAPVPYVDRLPGYVTLLAAIVALLGNSPAALALAHGAIGSLQASAAAAAGGAVSGVRGAWTAGLLVAGWPPLWRSDVQVLETGASGLVVTLLVAVALAARRRPGSCLFAAMACLGFAAVVLRPDYMLLPPALAVWLTLSGGRRALPWAALALALPLAAAGAWAARNARVADGPFVSVGLGTNLLAAVGESLGTDAPTFGDKDVAVAEGYQGLYWPDPARRDAERVSRALTLIRDHPAAYARGCVRRVAVTLSMYPGQLWPGPSAQEAVRRWRAANPGRPRYEGLFQAVADHARQHPAAMLGTFGWAPAALALAARGAWLLRRRRGDLLALLALPVYGVAVHVPLHAEPRYAFPFLPALLVLAAVALVPSGRAAEGPRAEA